MNLLNLAIRYGPQPIREIALLLYRRQGERDRRRVLMEALRAAQR